MDEKPEERDKQNWQGLVVNRAERVKDWGWVGIQETVGVGENRVGKDRGPSMLPYSANSVVEEVQSRQATLRATLPGVGGMWSSVTERTKDRWWEGWMRDDYVAGHLSCESRNLVCRTRLDEEPYERRIRDGLLTNS